MHLLVLGVMHVCVQMTLGVNVPSPKPRLRSLALCCMAAQCWGGLCTVISRYSKQTQSPSLKLSLEASDEMAQIMRHIINHRQGVAGSVYMCYTHSLPVYLWHTHTYTHRAYGEESGAEERHSSLRAEPRDHYPSSTFIQLIMAVLAGWSIATTLCSPRIKHKLEKVNVTGIKTGVPPSQLRNKAGPECNEADKKCTPKSERFTVKLVYFKMQ